MKRPSTVPDVDTFGRRLPLDRKDEDRKRAQSLKYLNRRYGRPAAFGETKNRPLGTR